MAVRPISRQRPPASRSAEEILERILPMPEVIRITSDNFIKFAALLSRKAGSAPK